MQINPNKYIEVFNRVPQKFRNEVEAGISTIGRSGLWAVQTNDSKYVLARKTSDLFPELKGVTPRGWPEGMTWDNAPGISPDHIPIIGCFSKPKAEGIDVMVRHETGHLLDKSFIPRIRCRFTDTPGYKEVYSADLSGLKPKLKEYGLKINDIQYIIQKSTVKKLTSGGLKESFAEFFAYLRGGNSMADLQIEGFNEIMEDLFPKSVEYVRKLLHLLGDK